MDVGYDMDGTSILQHMGIAGQRTGFIDPLSAPPGSAANPRGLREEDLMACYNNPEDLIPVNERGEKEFRPEFQEFHAEGDPHYDQETGMIEGLGEDLDAEMKVPLLSAAVIKAAGALERIDHTLGMCKTTSLIDNAVRTVRAASVSSAKSSVELRKTKIDRKKAVLLARDVYDQVTNPNPNPNRNPNPNPNPNPDLMSTIR